MKFTEIFRYEFLSQARSLWSWLVFIVMFVLAFMITRDGTLSEALHDDFFINSPFAIAKTTVLGTMIWLLLAGSVAGQAAARDVASGMHPLTYTTPIKKLDYLGGRFLAAFAINALLLLTIQVSMIVAVYLPGVDKELIGPFRFDGHLTAFAYLTLPSALLASSVQFLIALRAGRPMASYLGSVMVFVMSYIVLLFLLVQGRQDLANVLDPIGVHFVLSEMSHLWTTAEKSHRLLAFEGDILKNRLLSISVAGLILTLTYMTFHFSHRTESNLWNLILRLIPGRSNRKVADAGEIEKNIFVPKVTRTFRFHNTWRQTMAITWVSFRSISSSWGGRAMLILIPLLCILVLLDQMEMNGVPVIPTTLRILIELTSNLADEQSRWVIVPLLLLYFAGELIWRERDAGMGEISDTMPVSEWSRLLGKLFGMILIIAAFVALQIIAGMIAQLILGYNIGSRDLSLYITIMFGLQLPEYVLFAVLGLVVHTIVDQKYIGHMASLMIYVVILVAPLFGLEHNMLIYGAGPGWTYTEMQGFGRSIGPWLWFKLYWSAWAMLFTTIAIALWSRGKEASIRVRLKLAQRRLSYATTVTACLAAGLILISGGFIFINTNVLNEYLTKSQSDERRANYELLYGQYQSIPQPTLTAATLKVELFPDQGEASINGTYHLVNNSTVAIDSIHVATTPVATRNGLEAGALSSILRPSALIVNDQENGHQIYALDQSLKPGDSMSMHFQVRYAPIGFRESGVEASVMPNGTYVMIQNWLPSIGYKQDRELTSNASRRKFGLPDQPLIASLYDTSVSRQRSQGILFEVIIGTSEDQVAVAPGALRRSWVDSSGTESRRYFQYSTDAPIGNELPLFSAKYTMHETVWIDSTMSDSNNNVAIRVFHHPGHTAHVDRIVRSVKSSLDYYSKHFGPYEYSHLTIAERPGNGMGMHADASMITHAEGFTHWGLPENSTRLDLPYSVVMHEMGHQWGVPYARVEGAPVMSESLAWYYGMKALEDARGAGQLRRLRNFMMQPYPYPPIRRGEPLLRGLDPYMSYRRGPFALFALSKYVGEKQINEALRQLRVNHLGTTRLATTLDLYQQLKDVTHDSLNYLLHDLFEVNTFWELDAIQVKAKPTTEGTWEVTMDLEARKVVVDSAGTETEVQMDEWIQVGVFGAGEPGDDLTRPLYVKMHRIRSGTQTIVVTVEEEPMRGGIDPYHLLDWESRENEDNYIQVRK
jgi:ABC-2 type transport system permease protein